MTEHRPWHDGFEGATKWRAPKNWARFEFWHPSQELRPLQHILLGLGELGAIEGLNKAIGVVFPHEPDDRDIWELKLPGDCEDMALSLRALLHESGIAERCSVQPAFCKRGGRDHAIVVLHYSSNAEEFRSLVLDPSFGEAVDVREWLHGFLLRTNGEQWFYTGSVKEFTW